MVPTGDNLVDWVQSQFGAYQLYLFSNLKVCSERIKEHAKQKKSHSKLLKRSNCVLHTSTCRMPTVHTRVLLFAGLHLRELGGQGP